MPPTTPSPNSGLGDTAQRFAPHILLPLIILLAAILRFHALGGRGLIYWDEGKFALEGLRLLSIPGALLHHSAVAGKPVGTAKPTHALLIALAYALLGVRDSAPLYVDALCSVLCVPVLYLIASRLFAPAAGLAAAFLLAVSGYDAVYARSALSESDANLFFLCGVLLWLYSRNDREVRPTRGVWLRLASAAVLGLGLTTNYRLLVYIVLLAAVDLALLLRSEGITGRLKAGLTWAGVALVPLIWQIAGLWLNGRGLVLFQNEITGTGQSYLQELLYQVHGGKQAVMRFNPLIYADWYAVRQGWLFCMATLVSLLIAASRRSVAWVLPTVLVFGAYLIYAEAPFVVPRNLATTVPFASILVAGVLVEGARSATRRLSAAPIITVLLLLGVAQPGALYAWHLGDVRSGFRAAAGYVQAHHIQRVIVANETLQFYLRGPGTSCSTTAMSRDPRDIAADRRAGYTVAILDVYDTPVKRFILHHGRRIARYPSIGTTALGENLLASENGSPAGEHLDQHVDIYDLRSLPLHAKPAGSVPPCSQSDIP